MNPQQPINDNDNDFDGFRYPASVVGKAAQLVEKYAPVAARPHGSDGWWVYTNAIAYVLGDGNFQTGKDRVERAAKYLKMSPVTLYNDPLLQVEI